MAGAPQRRSLVLAVGVVAGATLLAARAAARRQSPVVREIVREPVVEVHAPDVEVPEPVVQVISQPESRLRRIAGVLALLGVISYVYLAIVYDRFYSALHVDPGDVGLSYGTTLSRSSGLIVIAVASIGIALFLLIWIRGWMGAAIHERPLIFIAAPALLAGVVVLWGALPVLAYAYTEPTREASMAGRSVLAGKPVAQVRLGNLITVIDLRAEEVTLIAAGSSSSAVTRLAKRTDLLYLGQADGTVVLFDPRARQALHLPADAVLIRLSRPSPRQGRSPLCTVSPPPSWWHGPGWLRDMLPQARGC